MAANWFNSLDTNSKNSTYFKSTWIDDNLSIKKNGQIEGTQLKKYILKTLRVYENASSEIISPQYASPQFSMYYA